MTSRDAATQPGAKRGAGAWAGYAAALVCLWAIYWLGIGEVAVKDPHSYKGRRNDYYSQLVHGFMKGHLYMDRVPDPRLESRDPVVRHYADYSLDASYYDKHYYLYFGATPAVVFLLPYAALTGNDLDPRFVAVLCIGLGFVFSFLTWRMFVRDHAPRLGALFQFFAVLALGFAPATPLLLTRSMFYEVAIATGYGCVMGAALGLYRALSGRGRPAANLALSSLFLGLAVGCRPDLVLTLPAVAAAAWVLARRRASAGNPGGLGGYAAAAVIPAALIGVCLATYNYERFGNPTDFGFKYCMNGFFDSKLPMASPSFYGTNVTWDYLTLPALSPYFPYVFPEEAQFRPPQYAGDEAIHGQFVVLALVAFVAFSAAVFGRRLKPGGAGTFVAIVGWMFLAPFIGLSSLCLRADRYLVDFQPSLSLATILVASLVAARFSSVIGRASWSLLFSALSLFLCAFNFFAGLQQFDAFMDLRYGEYARLEAIGNLPSAWLIKHGLLAVGPVRMKVVFPEKLARSRIEPLVALGTPGKSDALYVIEHEDNVIEFLGDHNRYGGHRSKFIPIVPGREYTLTIDLGAFYPPLNHTFFSKYNSLQARLVKSRLHVDLDGEEVMSDRMNSYDAPPWTLETGVNDISLSEYQSTFTGKIASLERLPPQPPVVARLSNGLWRIRCVFPMRRPNVNYPVLAIGLAGSGTLFFVDVQQDNRVQFGVDEWGYGAQRSGTFAATPDDEHEIDLFVGPLAKIEEWPKAWGIAPDRIADAGMTMRIWMDGKIIWESKLHHEFDPQDTYVDIGSNLQGFSTAEPDYFGPIKADPFSPEETRAFLTRNLEPAK